MGTSISLVDIVLNEQYFIRLREFEMWVNARDSKNNHAAARFVGQFEVHALVNFLDNGETPINGAFTPVNRPLPKAYNARAKQEYFSRNMAYLPVRVVGTHVLNAYKTREIISADTWLQGEVSRYNEEVQRILDQSQAESDKMADLEEELKEKRQQVDEALERMENPKAQAAVEKLFGPDMRADVLAYMRKLNCSAKEAIDYLIERAEQTRRKYDELRRKQQLYKASADIPKVLQGDNPLMPGKEELFRGYIAAIDSVTDEGADIVLTGKLISGTGLLDQITRSRSFQDARMTYRDVIETVVEDSVKDLQKKSEQPLSALRYKADGINVSLRCAEVAKDAAEPNLDTPIGAPLIQYKETNWNFIKRIASRLRLGVVSDVTAWDPTLTVGLCKPKARNDDSAEAEDDAEVKDMRFILNAYSAGFDKLYYELGGKPAGYVKKNFFHFDVFSLTSYPIGKKIAKVPTRATVNTDLTGFCVCGKTAIFKKESNEMLFEYILAMPAYVTQRKILFAMTDREIDDRVEEGEVLARREQKIKILLDIDARYARERGEPPIDKAAYLEKAYEYRWAPETGSAMYSMPTVGTKVALYFPDGDEQHAFSVHCVRQEERENCDGLQTYTDRYFTTEFDEQMFLKPTSMGFITKGNPLEIIQDDSGGITLESDGDINFAAAGDIAINASAVSFNGQKISVTGGG